MNELNYLYILLKKFLKSLIKRQTCSLCSQILATVRGLEWNSLQKLGELQTQLGSSLDKMLDLVEEVLHPEPYTREEICKMLGITAQQLCDNILSANTQHGKGI